MEVLITLSILVAPFVLISYVRKRSLWTQIQGAAIDLGVIITKHFLTQPCLKCHEFEMRLLTVSPNARSIQYLCRHCQKKQHAAATSPDAFDAAPKYERLQALIYEFNRRYGRNKPISVSIVFHTPEAPLPFEQTKREPISEAIRTEVWRRDGGKCVKCRSNQQLEFDHIIPVSRGGATSVRNLQLLCKPCNRAKSAKI